GNVRARRETGVGAMGTEACASGAAVGAADLLRLQAGMLWQRGFAPAAAALATALCGRLPCDPVAVGSLQSGCRAAVARSRAAAWDPRTAGSERIAAAMDEALEQASSVVLPARPGAAPQVSLAHAELAGTDARAVCTVLLADAGKPLGALTFERAGERFT